MEKAQRKKEDVVRKDNVVAKEYGQFNRDFGKLIDVREIHFEEKERDGVKIPEVYIYHMKAQGDKDKFPFSVEVRSNTPIDFKKIKEQGDTLAFTGPTVKDTWRGADNQIHARRVLCVNSVVKYTQGVKLSESEQIPGTEGIKKFMPPKNFVRGFVKDGKWNQKVEDGYKQSFKLARGKDDLTAVSFTTKEPIDVEQDVFGGKAFADGANILIKGTEYYCTQKDEETGEYKNFKFIAADYVSQFEPYKKEPEVATEQSKNPWGISGHKQKRAEAEKEEPKPMEEEPDFPEMEI